MDTPTTRGVCFISNKETKMSLTEELVLKRSKAENLEAVRNLNCWGCNLSDVQVLSKLENLEVLNLSCNNLSSLKDLKECSKLRELFIRQNKLSDFNELLHLKQLPHLKVLWLSNNPFSEDPSYKTQVTQILPQLVKLDNIDVNETVSSKQVSKQEGGDNVLKAVQMLLREMSQTQLETVRDSVNSLLLKH